MKKVLAILLVMASVMVSCEKDDSKPKDKDNSPKESKAFSAQDYQDLGSPVHLIISDEYTEIGEEAMKDSHLKTVTIPSTITYIGNSAFEYCRDLTSVTIPSTITHIGNSAFGYCSDLTSVTIGNSVTEIDNNAFYQCISLESITIPNSVKFIGGWAFSFTPWLKKQTDEFVIVGSGVLIKYNGDDKDVTIPSSVTSIGGSAFEYSPRLETVTIPNSVKFIWGGGAFILCPSLESINVSTDSPIKDELIEKYGDKIKVK